jgi:HEAT repeat protein
MATGRRFRRLLFAGLCAAAFAMLPLLAEAAEPPVSIGKLAAQLTVGDRDVRRDASYHLMQLGPKALPALPELIKALDDADKQVWSNSIETIALIGPDAVDAIPKLLKGLERYTDNRPPNRGNVTGGGVGRREQTQTIYRCADALARIGEAAKPPLLAALNEENSPIRFGAVKALGGMRAAARTPSPR